MECSIVICTRNRADSLEGTLRAVLDQDYDRGNLEILVVDNGSTDRTEQVAQSFMPHSRCPLRYLYEPKVGLSHARNCATKEAQGTVILFIDDDARPFHRRWAAHLVQAYDDPQVGAAGGDLEPVWPNGKRPDWLHHFLVPPLGLTRFDNDRITELHYPRYPWGANISFRKACLEEFNGFSPELGWSAGGTMVAGEESELCLRLEKAGKKIVYVPDATVQHVILPDKLAKASLMERASGHGLSDATIDLLHARKSRVLVKLVRKCMNVVVHLGGAACFSLLRWQRMRLLSEYNVRYAGSYVLRVVRLR
jgi:glycosyltransferase involved in cell wall biosynthesis